MKTSEFKSKRVQLCKTKAEDFPYIQYLIASELSEADIEQLAQDSEVKYLQMSSYVPENTLKLLNEYLFAKRQDIQFRVFGFYGEICDLDFLKHMTNVTDLLIDCSYEVMNIEILKSLKNLKKLGLYLDKLKDYSFIKEISPKIAELSLYTDGNICNMDCEWLSGFTRLESLYIGKVRKNICALSKITSLRKLTLQGITCNSLDFLMGISLESLSIRWGAMKCFKELENHPTLNDVELWRISRLENQDIEFMTRIPNLQKIHLWQLSHITGLPQFQSDNKIECIDIEECKNFKDVHAVQNMRNLRRIRLIGNVSEEDMKYVFENLALEYILYYCGNAKQRERVNAKIEALGKSGKTPWMY